MDQYWTTLTIAAAAIAALFTGAWTVCALLDKVPKRFILVGSITVVVVVPTTMLLSGLAFRA